MYENIYCVCTLIVHCEMMFFTGDEMRCLMRMFFSSHLPYNSSIQMQLLMVKGLILKSIQFLMTQLMFSKLMPKILIIYLNWSLFAMW